MGTNIFREYLRESEINDYFKELEEDNREYFKLLYHNSHPLLDNMNEAVIKPEMIKINSNISNLQDLNDEFKKLRVNFYNDKELHAYYNQEKDEINVYFNTSNTKLELEAIIGHEMIHREQNKRSNGNYFERAKKLTSELNKIAQEFNKSNDVELLKKYNIKQRFRDYNDSYEQMAYVYQTMKEHPNYTPTDMVNYFKKFGFGVDFRLKKYIGMYYLIRNSI